MKKILLLSILLISNLFFASTDDLFLRGNELYKSENFKEALEIYDSILKQGEHSFELYFNMGNCYYKQNNITLSKLYYEKAKKIDSKDEELLSNLAIINSLLIDKIDVLQKPIMGVIVDYIFSIFSYKFWGYLSIISSFLSFIFYIFYRKNNLLNRQKLYFMLFLFTILLSFCFLGASLREYNIGLKNIRALVYANNSYIKNEPKEGAQDLFIVHEGTVLLLLGKNEKWVKIKLEDGKIGWIKQADILEI